jgi:electron transfer flavoprotein alpha subunit
VACVLVHTEVDGGLPTLAAQAVLGEARRIGSSLGAVVYAVAWVGAGDDPARCTAALGRCGADRVVVVPAVAPATLWLTIGAALTRVCDHLRPRLVIFANDGGGRDIAPRLAARLGAAYVPDPSIETGPRGEVILARPVYDGELWRRVQLDELDHPAVITLATERSRAYGDDVAEPVTLSLESLTTAVDISALPGTSGDALDRARIIVVAGAGVSAATMPLVLSLATRLGAEIAGTRAVCERGQVDASRHVGVGARTVAPALYVVLGASGSTAHLGAVAHGTEIVAIDRDPRAPIWKAARWGLVGELEQLIPALLSSLGVDP